HTRSKRDWSSDVCSSDLQGNQVRGRIGYLPQELTMYSSLTVFEFVHYMAELKGVRDRGAAAAALEQVEMVQFAKRRIGQLSGGKIGRASCRERVWDVGVG